MAKTVRGIIGGTELEVLNKSLALEMLNSSEIFSAEGERGCSTSCSVLLATFNSTLHDSPVIEDNILELREGL